MAFRIEVKGSLSEVVDAVAAAKTHDGNPSSQLEAVRAIVASELEAYKGRFPRFEVRAAGDESPTQRNVSITVNGLNAEE